MIKPVQFNYIVDSYKPHAVPDAWRPRMVNAFYQKQKAAGYHAAKIDLLDTLDKVDGYQFGMASDDDSLVQFAKARADECFRVAAMFMDKDQALHYMEKVAHRYGIEPPQGNKMTDTGRRMRLLNEHWWRRRIRKTAARNVEAAAINVGLVSRVAGLYASDEAVKRRAGQLARNRRILSSMTATNDVGQSYNVQDLADLGVGNKSIRRMELMTRIAGFDHIAMMKGHAAEFYTLTAPSKYHARHHITGKVQKNYNGATPADTQKYLVKVWSRIRAKLHRDKVDIYGVRVAEPHHDGTPHWHMILFFNPRWAGRTERAAAPRIRAIMRRYALQEDGNEDGAKVHRFKAEAIDRKRGSAVGYIAKYISKNIDGLDHDGDGIGEDYEAIAGEDSATATAKRVDAWASTWGIRQFQQLGGQSVTVWRELRRVDVESIQNERFQDIAKAADAGEWDKYTLLMGGVVRSFYEYPRFGKRGNPLANGRKAIKAKFVTLRKKGAIDTDTGEVRLNVYNEPAADVVTGVGCVYERVDTRLRQWVFKRGGETATPRSSVNNCTQLAEKNAIEQSRMKKEHEKRVAKWARSPHLRQFNDAFDNEKGWDSRPWQKLDAHSNGARS